MMKKLIEIIKKRFEVKIVLPEHYVGIDDMLQVRWDAIKQGEGLENVLIKKRPITNSEAKELAKIWRSMNDEFTKVFGFPKQLNLIIAKKIRISKLIYKKILTGDQSISNLIRKHQKELLAMTASAGSGMDMYDAKIIIERHNPGLHLPMGTVTVREFQAYLKDIEKRSKPQYNKK